jgi:putative transposase
MIVTRCYKYRLRPTVAQIETLVQWAGCRRWLWNWALQRKQAHYGATGKNLSYNTLAGELVDLKRQPATVWLKDCHSQVLQQVLMDLETAFANFFAKRAKYPRWKSRKATPHSLRFPQNVTVVDGATISVPKIGLVKVVIHRPLMGVVKGATIKQDATGAWFVVFVCHIDRPDVTPTCDSPVGIDVGLESFMTLHTGQKTAPPKFYRRGERKLKRAQRRLSRAQKGSNNRKKAKRQVARVHQRIRNQRADWLHKQALGIIRHFDTVCIETLNVKGLMRTKLAKSFSDAALSTFMQMLNHKAAWHGRQVVPIGRFYASSKTCHRCGEKADLTLSDRVWTCGTCGTTHDRDINAAINILHEGLRIVAAGMSETQNATGDAVRPAIAGGRR